MRNKGSHTRDVLHETCCDSVVSSQSVSWPIPFPPTPPILAIAWGESPDHAGGYTPSFRLVSMHRSDVIWPWTVGGLEDCLQKTPQEM